jgi:hypothetical protein
MQDDLFGAPPAPPPLPPPAQPPGPAPAPRRTGGEVLPAPHDEALRALGAALPARLRLGTSSWSYPG